MAVRNKNPKSSFGHSMVDLTVAVLGAGAAAPTVPADGAFTPTTSTFPRGLNAVSTATADIPTRSGVGVYVITYASDLKPKTVSFAQGCVLSAGSAPTSVLVADVTIVDPVARQITVKVSTPNGTATDLGTSDMLVIYLHGQDSGKS